MAKPCARGSLLEAEAAERRLDPASGLMLQAVWFDAGAERSGRLLLCIHHLAVDGVSWRILVPDLEAAWRQIAAGVAAGQAVALPPRGTSFRRWAQRLALHARSAALREELPFWRGQQGLPSLQLTQGKLDPVRDVLGTAGHLTMSLPAEVTQALLTRVPSAFHGGIDDVLLGALSVAVADWCRRQVPAGSAQGVGQAGGHAVLIDLEGHGREEGFGREEGQVRDEGPGREEGLGGVDLTRTVGWFTSLYPVRLDPSGFDASGLDSSPLDLNEALAGGLALGRAVKTVKQQLRAVPGKGLGYGVLRYLNDDTAAELAGGVVPQLGFNYLGRLGPGGSAGGTATGGWAPAGEEVGAGGGDPAMPLAHPLEINALTLDGAEGPRLSARLSFAPALIGEAAVRDLAATWFRALTALVQHTAQAGAGGRTPSDLPLVSLSQAEIERLEQAYPDLEDILPLSPLQEGLLFHALYDAHGPDVYTVQLELELDGALDAARLAASLRAVMKRHHSLRSGFVHQGLGRPVQVVLPQLDVPWRLIDLSELNGSAQQDELAGIAAADRLERFDLASPPLIRLAVIRLGAARHRLLLSNHHLLMDGWSAPILVREWLFAYGQGGSADELPAVTPYRDYLALIARADRAAGLAAWQEALAGLEEGTHLVPRQQSGAAPVAPQSLVLPLDVALQASLQACARAQAVTLNTLIQATFGVLLGRLTGRDDVVFGVTVSGRPAELSGVEQMVGLFINTLPLRMRLSPGLTLAELLHDTQERQSALLAHQHIGLSEIQQAAGIGELFDTLLVFENYPVDREGLAAPAGGLRLGAVEGRDATHYPLALLVQPGEVLRLRLDHRPDLISRGEAELIGARLIRLLTAAAADATRPLGALPILDDAERDTLLRLWNDTASPVPPATLPELFAQQAARTPDAIAVMFEGRSLSYAALDAEANRLAHHLRGLGVGPDVLVGICLERSPKCWSGSLASSRPAAPICRSTRSYPRERLAVMVADAGVPRGADASGAGGKVPMPAGVSLVRLDADRD